MKRSGYIKALISLFCIVAFTVGCSMAGNDFTTPDPETAESDMSRLVITLHSGVFSAKTIAPPITMEIASYDIRGTGPDPLYDHFSDPANTTGFLTLSALNTGLWTITVAAKNAAGTIIGHGQTEPPVLLSAGLVTNAQIDILPLAGPGEFNLAVQWPKGAHKNVSAQASLTSMITGQDLAPVFVFTPPGNPETGTYSNSAIEAGYYLLLLRLYNTGVQFWGVAESVRIIAGQTTSQSWVLN